MGQSEKRYRYLRNARRVSQGAFLALFLFLLLRTNIDALESPDALPRISAPVDFFLEIDPLVAVATLLTTHTLYRDLVLALIVVVGTLFLGRFFCGWVCPMGTINHMLAAVKSARMKGRRRMEQNAWQPYQRWKYGILAAMLGGIAVWAESNPAGL